MFTFYNVGGRDGIGVEFILDKNKHLKDSDVAVGYGLEITAKPFDMDELITYRSPVVGHICKVDLTDDKYLKGLKPGVAVSFAINRMINDFQNEVKHNNLISVLEQDLHTEKLINVDMIQDVRGFVFDPQEV